MFDLKGKVAIVTGGAKGIGAATVRSFLREGAKFVAFMDTDENSGMLLEQELLKEYKGDVVKFFKCDVTKDEELFGVFDYTITHSGCIDLVVNNAAICNDTIHKKEIEINFTAVVTSTLKLLQIMRKDQGGRGGTIINISSIGALMLPEEPTAYVYCATKCAVLFFSTSLGMEAYYSHTGVRVISMCFGLTTTDIVPNVKSIDEWSTNYMLNSIPKLKSQPPEAAAAGIVEAFKKGKTGSIWLVMDQKITDVTERVSKAYKVMSEM